MDRRPCAIEGELVAIKLAGRMEETLRAFAVRAACFIGELDRSFSEEFDGQDFSAVHLLAYLGEEPIGTVRIRWFQSFAMPDRVLQAHEASDRVWRALDQLPFDQRTVIVLREIDGLSYEEIADSLGVAVGTVKSRLARARETLRTTLRPV